MGTIYLVCALVLGPGLLGAAARLLVTHRLAYARTMFWLSSNCTANQS